MAWWVSVFVTKPGDLTLIMEDRMTSTSCPVTLMTHV